VQESVTDNTN
jgi:arginine decarboxylase-like protein